MPRARELLAIPVRGSTTELTGHIDDVAQAVSREGYPIVQIAVRLPLHPTR